MAEKTYGRTASGREITEALIEEFVAEAEAGYDVDELIARRQLGRTAAPATARKDEQRPASPSS